MWRSNATGIRSLSGLLLIVVAMLASPRKAGADVGTNSSSQCDGVLLPQLVIANSTRLQRLALISLITRENYEQVKRGIVVDLGIGPLSLGANYDEFDRNRSASSEFRDFKYSNAEARAIVRQSLSADQINAWVRCMSLANTVGIKLILSNDNKDGVNVELRYDGTVDTRFKFTVEADGGTIKNKTTRT